MSTESIRELLFKVAEEFKTTDEETIAKIDDLIEIYSSEVDSVALGSNLELGTAYYTAWSLTDKQVQESGHTGLIVSERSHNEEVKYANNTKPTDSSDENNIFYSNNYGKKYLNLLKNQNKPTKSGAIKKITYRDPVFDNI